MRTALAPPAASALRSPLTLRGRTAGALGGCAPAPLWAANLPRLFAFLPPYSPDLNPIEMMGSKVKSILRKLGPRDNGSLFEAVGMALAAVRASDAPGWFAHCGYNST